MERKKNIEAILQGTCSEAVFRFFTLEPAKIQQILQLIADEIASNTDFEPHQNQKIPLFEKAEMYDTLWKEGQMHYHGDVRQKYDKQINKIWKDRDIGKITQKEALERYGEIEAKISKELYPNALLRACAGLGDNEAVVTIEPEEGSFRLNIGNNDIAPNKTGWIEQIEAMSIKVEEAETNKELADTARDCTCGIVFFGERGKAQRAQL